MKQISESNKLYYSIKEVAEMVGENESLLRYWEKEFPSIRPKKIGRNIRQYTKADIENIRMIHFLVKEKGMTLAGARQKLKQNPHDSRQTVEIVERLKAIKAELLNMRKELDNYTPDADSQSIESDSDN